MENSYEEYAVLSAKIKDLTNKRDELKVVIIQDLAEQELTTIDTSVGKFSISNLKTWTYTDKVNELAEELKAKKASEESTGDATFEEKSSLRFTTVKL